MAAGRGRINTDSVKISQDQGTRKLMIQHQDIAHLLLTQECCHFKPHNPQCSAFLLAVSFFVCTWL